jgi:excisionase family DNA binding protein
VSVVSRPIDPSAGEDWLALGPASRLVGVDPDTLRRWAIEGRVDAYATPGGHRRFARRSLERLISARRIGPRGALAGLGATPDRVSAAYRRGYGRPPTSGPDPRASVPATEREAFRDEGRLLVEALLGHLDAMDETERGRTEAAAAALTADLGRRLAASGVSLADAVALFVAARRPFLSELGALARRRSLATDRMIELYDRASTLLDRLLLRFVAAHDAAAPLASPRARAPRRR